MSPETPETSRATASEQGQRIALLGLVFNAALAVTKLITGVLGHSYALVADSVESMADIVGSLIVWGGVRIGRRPPDMNHPYGHGKAEALAALAVATLLVGAAIGITVAAVREIRTPHHSPAPYTLWVLLLVVAAKETFYRIARRTARTIDSEAILAEAWHHRSDAITSLAAAIGIGIALIGGPDWAAADDWAAIVASVVIVVNAIRLLRAPVGELMDVQPREMLDRVASLARSVDGVKEVETVHARKSGASYWVDMHIEVDPQMSVQRAHDLAHVAKDTICGAMPEVRDVLIHVEPHRS